MCNIQDTIAKKLTGVLKPQKLEIIDTSNDHENHVNHLNRGHFHLIIISNEFNGLSHVARQKLVYNLLVSELQEHIHALSMQTLTPEEAKKNAS